MTIRIFLGSRGAGVAQDEIVVAAQSSELGGNVGIAAQKSR